MKVPMVSRAYEEASPAGRREESDVMVSWWCVVCCAL